MGSKQHRPKLEPPHSPVPTELSVSTILSSADQFNGSLHERIAFKEAQLVVLRRERTRILRDLNSATPSEE